MNNSCSLNIQLSIPKTDVYLISFFKNTNMSGSLYFYKRGQGVPQLLDTQTYLAASLKSGDIIEIFGNLKGVEEETKLQVRQIQALPHEYSITYNLYDFVKKDNDSKTWLEYTPDFLATTCSHEWKHYQGLLDSYNYCVKCDMKDKQ